MKEYIIYEGECFTLEWYYDEKGNSKALKYFMTLSAVQQRKTLMLFKRIGDFGRISDITKFRNEGDKIFAFKPQPDRFLSFFYVGKKLVVTNGFLKKGQKLPKSEKELSLKCKADFEKRVKNNGYYE